ILLLCYNRLDYRVGHSVDGASGDTEPLAASAIQPAGTGPHAGGLRCLAEKKGYEIGLLDWRFTIRLFLGRGKVDGRGDIRRARPLHAYSFKYDSGCGCDADAS